MIPSRTSRSLTEWTTPSAFQLHRRYVDDDEQDFDLGDAHFYIVGNHYILHHLDYYILQENSKRMVDYLRDQRIFWAFVGITTDMLQWKLLSYTRPLPENTTLGIPTSEMMLRVDHILEAITDEVNDFPQQQLHQNLKPALFITNRLIEDVKDPPPFIPRMLRRHSFS